jgi:hypothetical protein
VSSVEITRTLVKSPPELWSELQGERLADAVQGEITKSSEEERRLHWSGSGATGTVQLEPSSWGTKVTLTAEVEESVATLGLTIGCIVFGLLADRFGAARILMLGCAALLVATYALYIGLGRSPQHLDSLYALAGFCVGVVGVIPTVLVRAFPAAVRFSGISFAYNIAYAIFGGLTPLFVTLLMKNQLLAPAHYVAALCGVGIATAAWIAAAGSAAPREVSPAAAS